MNVSNFEKPVNGQKNIEGIQYLRGLAALMVVFHHSRNSFGGEQLLPGFGFTGVDIFFVISGFVMAYTTQSLDPNYSLKGRLLYSYEFIRKRLIRIVPLYYFCIVWVSRKELFKGVIPNDLLKDLLFFPHVNSQYPAKVAPIVIQGWTLNYEMLFYILFGLGLILGKIRTFFVITALSIFVVVGLFLNNEGLIAKDVVLDFYTRDIILEFGLGILAQKILFKWNLFQFSRSVWLVIALFGFILLYKLSNIQNPRIILSGIPAFIIVVSITRASVDFKSYLLKLLGDSSYSIYLFHLSSFGAIKPLQKLLESSANDDKTILLLVFASISVSVISGVIIHVFIEKPVLKRLRSIGKIAV
ncbi:MAG: acyltransferase [Methylococcaceae bacterium]|nr:acyltransferase [Methylococcaceae bacterium]